MNAKQSSKNLELSSFVSDRETRYHYVQHAHLCHALICVSDKRLARHAYIKAPPVSKEHHSGLALAQVNMCCLPMLLSHIKNIFSFHVYYSDNTFICDLGFQIACYTLSMKQKQSRSKSGVSDLAMSREITYCKVQKVLNRAKGSTYVIYKSRYSDFALNLMCSRCAWLPQSKVKDTNLSNRQDRGPP